jgi:hypothetical protein
MRFDNVIFTTHWEHNIEVSINFDSERHTFHVIDMHRYGDTSLVNAIDLIRDQVLRKVGIYDYPPHVFHWVLYDIQGRIYSYQENGKYVELDTTTPDLYTDFVNTVISHKN